MINSVSPILHPLPSEDAAVDTIVRSGARGAIVLAGLGTAVVVALWFAFYVCVFLPRAPSP